MTGIYAAAAQAFGPVVSLYLYILNKNNDLGLVQCLKTHVLTYADRMTGHNA